MEETEAMFRKHVEWRQENKIDTILTNNPLPMEDPMIANIAADIIGTDKEGNTILAVFSAQMEMKRIVQTYGKGVSMQIVYYFLEMAYADIVARSTDMSNFRSAVYIVDLDSFKFKEFMSADGKFDKFYENKMSVKFITTYVRLLFHNNHHFCGSFGRDNFKSQGR